jgi:hypothetical protein
MCCAPVACTARVTSEVSLVLRRDRRGEIPHVVRPISDCFTLPYPAPLLAFSRVSIVMVGLVNECTNTTNLRWADVGLLVELYFTRGLTSARIDAPEVAMIQV